jgi:hypothetical protein
MILGVIGVMLAGALALLAFGNAVGAKGRHQRAADLAAISAAQVMRDLYPRLFEPPFLERDVPNPRHRGGALDDLPAVVSLVFTFLRRAPLRAAISPGDP